MRTESVLLNLFISNYFKWFIFPDNTLIEREASKQTKYSYQSYM